jgi:hypothetical protein
MSGVKTHDDEVPELEALLGTACLLNVMHVDKDRQTYTIQTASPLARDGSAAAL